MGKVQQLKAMIRRRVGGVQKAGQSTLAKGSKSIGFKMASGYAALAVLVLISGGVSLYQMYGMQKNTGDIIHQNIPALDKIHNINYFTERVMAVSMQHILNSDPAEKSKLEEERTQFIRKVAETFKEYKQNLHAEQELQQLQSLTDKWSEFMTVNNQAIKLSGSSDKELALEVSRKGITAFNSMQTDLDALVAHSQEDAANKGSISEKIFHTSLTLNIITVVIVLIVIGLINMVIRKTMINPLKKVTSQLQQISGGDLTADETLIGNMDEIGLLAKTVNETNRTLLEMVSRIRSVSEVISGQGDELMRTIAETKEGSSQIALTMEELAVASGSQAEAAVDASKAVEELNALIEHFAVRGNDLSLHSEQVRLKGEKGGALMESSVAQMNGISEAVSQSMETLEELNRKNEGIFRLVGSIRSISEQTHLLAINAAIEAARAGDSGRGFAVVAQEVRKLSEEVQQTVSEITGITQGIQHDSRAMVEQLRSGVAKTEEGSRQIVETGEALAEINSSVVVMAATVEDMGKDLQQMTGASETMNEFSQHISALAEESAAGVEETSASAHEQLSATSEVADGIGQLKDMLNELRESVARFKV
ncbi:methyl-accepting chemotaxis protein [Paenibacillus sp. MMS20-IR301]|uniref:methyl-accepting chemotaxis protein n=1 Tax=Paenibacillus sp. MMS20-IR301 TaxID=2895946 RepID=UPI0028E9E669|nr:methyl-accepting chemotaxis protein [Paenibacillus sp. MMS20-IR301]WNS41252.1 methyl-accepting chemotaxis protein [Paenibacillus sp. MMS20-IR301]